MTATLTRDETIRALIAQGVPREKAEQTANHLHPTESVTSGYVQVVGPMLAFPICFTLPWTALCSDNEREAASLTTMGGKPVPRKVLTARYKAARNKTREIAKPVMLGFAPLARPLALRALVYVPDERLHDVCNFAKCCHDALENLVYTNDRWLHDTRWTRAGVDVDRPRAEIQVTPL